MPVFLQEFLLAFRFFLPQLLCPFQIFSHALVFWHISPPLDFFAFFLPCHFIFLFLLYSAKFAQPPCFEFSSRIYPIRIVDVRDFFLFLL